MTFLFVRRYDNGFPTILDLPRTIAFFPSNWVSCSNILKHPSGVQGMTKGLPKAKRPIFFELNPYHALLQKMYNFFLYLILRLHR